MNANTLFSVMLLLFLTSQTSFADQSNNVPSESKHIIPQPNWSVLSGEPLNSTHKGNRTVDVFESKRFKNSRPIDYAWVEALHLDDECLIVAWIHEKDVSKRITFNSKKTDNHCTIYVSRADFEEYFRYCFLSGIRVYDGSIGYGASFGGGPSGDRDEYWFEWWTPNRVSPNFICILK